MSNMQMKKSYHMIRAHDHGRCPTLDEYRDAITYGSRFPFEQKYSLRVHIAEEALSTQIWDWYSSVCTWQPADWDNFKEHFHRMMIYYWVPFGEEYDQITDRMMDALIQGDGDSWGPMERSKIWCLYREHLVTYLLHVGYVTSYLKNQGFMGQMMCTQVGKHVTSWNKTFGHLFGKCMPLMLVAHHTDPHVINSRMLTWTHDDMADEMGNDLGETHHAGEYVEQQNFIVDPNTRGVTRISKRSQIPPTVSNMERYYNLLDDSRRDLPNHYDTTLVPTTTAEGEKID